jgi:hypothetical protein
VNLAIAAPVAILSFRLLANQSHPDRPHIDLPGVLTGSAGLFAVVYGFSNAETHSWSDPVTIIALVASAALLCWFIVIERRCAQPLLPLHIVVNRARGGAYASILLAGSGTLGAFLFLTYFMQQNLGFSPLTTGVAFLPMTVLMVLSSTISQTRILPRTGAKPLITIGMTLCAVAMLVLTRLNPSSGYTADVLPSLIVLGLGLGMIFAPAIGTATLGVNRNEAGVASAMVTTSQQIGGSVGTALLSTLFASSASAFARTHAGLHGLQTAAQVHGYTTAFWWSAGIFAVGLLIALVVFPMRVEPTEPALVAESADQAELALATK